MLRPRLKRRSPRSIRSSASAPEGCRPEAVPAQWRAAPPDLPEPQTDPGPLTALRREVEAAFWHLLAYQHDGMTAEAEAAQQRCITWVSQLRQAYDPHPALGPEAADAMIATVHIHAFTPRFVRCPWRMKCCQYAIEFSAALRRIFDPE